MSSNDNAKVLWKNLPRFYKIAAVGVIVLICSGVVVLAGVTAGTFLFVVDVTRYLLKAGVGL